MTTVLRGDIARLKRCTAIETTSSDDPAPARVKPLKYLYEKEVVLYAHYLKLPYFATECTYAPVAYRGYVRELLKVLM